MADSLPQPRTMQRVLRRGDPLDERVALVALLRSGIVGKTHLPALLDYLGSAVDLLPTELGGADLPAHPLLRNALSAETVEVASREVERWADDGLDVRTMLDGEYPANLQAVYDKPPMLFFEGAWRAELDQRAIAVVGTRSASEDGRRRATRLAMRLARAGITVISGLAKGIDASAHVGALKAGGRTVAVMGTGIRRRYPAENASLAAVIVRRGGALISQFFPDQHPTKWTFPLRNVTMSGLCLATVVVEAGATSGAKLQAEAALTHGRAVFLPRSLVKAHEWAERMVREGYRGASAIEVASPDEVIDALDASAFESLALV